MPVDVEAMTKRGVESGSVRLEEAAKFLLAE